MAEVNLAQALTRALDHVLATNPETLVLGEDVGRTGGVFRITDGLQEKYGADRVIDTPVAESGIVGAAFGMAVAGLRPIAEIQFLGFAYPAYDQIVSHVSRIRHRSQHRFTAPLVIRIPYGAGIGAAEHHSESTEAIFAHTPGLKLVVPATPADAAGLLLTAVEDPDPVVFLEPIRSYRRMRGEVADPPAPVPFGEAITRRAGADVTMIAYGAMVPDVLDAAEHLAAAGIDAEVIDLRTLVPLDFETVIGSVTRTGRAVVVQEGHRTCGFGAELAATIQEEALYSLQAPVGRVTGFDTVVPLRRAEHHYVPGVGRIVAAAEAAMGGS
ncbi:MAG: alpha-ketoacid dehydrogenase subunit beta [Acidimicrobiia bacterium]|nr:alpha-ketoacid dehydrogenase subunit beta [Acidimicrobiia bacterium]